MWCFMPGKQFEMPEYLTMEIYLKDRRIKIDKVWAKKKKTDKQADIERVRQTDRQRQRQRDIEKLRDILQTEEPSEL